MVEVSSRGIEIRDVVAVARDDDQVALADDARRAMAESAALVERLADSDEPVYGVSTGFGSLATTPIPPARRAELQRALIRSHAAGMGAPVEREVVRAMMLLRARSLAMGYSGARPEVGDAIEPLTLAAKEGLALVNGTDGILGMLALAIEDLGMLLPVADVTAAMSVEALLGTDRAFAPDLIALRPHPGQAASAANMHRLLEGSAIVASHRYDDPRVQDAYSLRCAPQVNGAARDTVAHARRVAEAELGSAIDNPMILPDGRVESCGNFHGAPVGFACDFLAVAAAEVGAIAERRTDRLLDASRSQGLPPFLAQDPGVDSGLMLTQYTQAAMVAENRRLASPASVDSLPTSAMQEDHVSMGWAAARKLRASLDNLAGILGVELAASARALELRAPLEPAPATAAALEAVRRKVPGFGEDRWLSPELAAAKDLVTSGAVIEAAAARMGALR